MVHSVKELFEVYIHYPTIPFRHVLSSLQYCTVRASPRPKPITPLGERRVGTNAFGFQKSESRPASVLAVSVCQDKWESPTL